MSGEIQTLKCVSIYHFISKIPMAPFDGICGGHGDHTYILYHKKISFAYPVHLQYKVNGNKMKAYLCILPLRVISIESVH